MKKILIIAILLLPALFACDPDSKDGASVVTSVVLSRDKVDLHVGESTTITATVLPESLGMGVVWSILDEEYAEVKDGTITAKAEGVTYAVATSADGSKKAACMVSVNPTIQYTTSIRDENGQVLSAIYGYPGQKIKLSAETSDGGIHSFTWSLEDASVGTITADGQLTLAANESTAAGFVYDAESSVKVTTEAGYGCKIPVRSSLLNGLKVGDVFNPAGTPIIVQASETYPIGVMYQGADSPLAIPADDIDVTLSNSTFQVQKAEGAYKLTTGPSTGVSTKLSVSFPGSSESIEIAELKIDKVYGITAQFAAASSSTLSFTWTEGVSAEDDIAKPYTIYLYKDEECTDLEVSFSIPAGDGCWKGRQPKFIFSGLTPATTYWFKVDDTTSGAEKDSPVIAGTTEAFTIVEVSSDPAAEGDIILAEDFGQLCWGADEVSQSAGYDVATSSTAYNTDTKKSFTSRDVAEFVGTTSQYAQRSLTAQSVAKKESGVRFAKWAQGQYARIYIGPGYMFLSTTSYGTHILTPELVNIPEGKTAKVKVTFHASGKVSGGKAALAVQHGTSFYEISSNNQTNKASQGHPVNLTTNVETITFDGGLTNLQEFEVTLDGLVNGDRIAFGPTSETAKDNSNMMLLSDFTVQIIELK